MIEIRKSCRESEARMLSAALISDRVLEVVRTNPHCSLDEVVQQLPDLHWSDVFMEVERLNRSAKTK